MRRAVVRLFLRIERRALERQIRLDAFDRALSLRLDRVIGALEAIGD